MTSHPSTTLPPMEGCAASGLWTYEAVEARLVEAMWVSRRMPNHGAGWQHVKAYWPDMRDADIFDYGGEGIDGVSHVRIRPPRLSGHAIDAAQEAVGWLGRFLDEDARRLVVLAAGWMASGRRVGWTRVGRILALGVKPDAVEVRYIKAVALIACGLNGKGEASWRAMVRRQRVAKDRRAVSDEAPAQGRVRGQRRRRIEVDVVYSD